MIARSSYTRRLERTISSPFSEIIVRLVNVLPHSFPFIRFTNERSDCSRTPCAHSEYTCFANTLERLIRLDGPVRKLKSLEDAMPGGQAVNAPREFMRLINWMMTHVSATVRTTRRRMCVMVFHDGGQSALLFEYPAQERLCHVIREVGRAAWRKARIG